jgi:hypothetical protein
MNRLTPTQFDNKNTQNTHQNKQIFRRGAILSTSQADNRESNKTSLLSSKKSQFYCAFNQQPISIKSSFIKEYNLSKNYQDFFESRSNQDSYSFGSTLQRMDVKRRENKSEYETYLKKAESFKNTLKELMKDKEICEKSYIDPNNLEKPISLIDGFTFKCREEKITEIFLNEEFERLFKEINEDYCYGNLRAAIAKLRKRQSEAAKINEPIEEKKKKIKGPKTEKSVWKRLLEGEVTADSLFRDGIWKVGKVKQAYRSNFDKNAGCFSIKIEITGQGGATKYVIHAHVIRQLHSHIPYSIASSGGGGAVHVKKTGWNQIEGQDNEPNLRLSLGAIMNDINVEKIKEGYDLLSQEDKSLKKL